MNQVPLIISVPVLLDPIIALRLLHHWILSRKISIQQQQQQTRNNLSVVDVSNTVDSSVLVVSNKATPPLPPPLRIRRELSLPNNDETTTSAVVTRLEAQLLPNVIRVKCISVSAHDFPLYCFTKKKICREYIFYFLLLLFVSVDRWTFPL